MYFNFVPAEMLKSAETLIEVRTKNKSIHVSKTKARLYLLQFNGIFTKSNSNERQKNKATRIIWDWNLLVMKPQGECTRLRPFKVHNRISLFLTKACSS